jgi:hypothetical protein
MRNACVLAASAAFVVAGSAASALTTAYSSRDGFEAAAVDLVVDSFNDIGDDTNVANTTVNRLGYQFRIETVVGPGFNFFDALPATSVNAVPNGTTSLVVGLLENEVLRFVFNSAITAFGADFNGLNDRGQRSQFEAAGEVVLAPILAGQVPSFFGIISDTPFSEVIIRGLPLSDGFGMDNVTYAFFDDDNGGGECPIEDPDCDNGGGDDDDDGGPAPVPVPASLPLIGLGLAALGLAGRRRG